MRGKEEGERNKIVDILSLLNSLIFLTTKTAGTQIKQMGRIKTDAYRSRETIRHYPFNQRHLCSDFLSKEGQRGRRAQ